MKSSNTRLDTSLLLNDYMFDMLSYDIFLPEAEFLGS